MKSAEARIRRGEEEKRRRGEKEIFGHFIFGLKILSLSK